jgi:class 3 adenylate cyclase
VIGAGSRLEYVAVGAAVNLASRLCSEALHGQVLVDARTAALAGGLGAVKLLPAASLTLKGFREPVASFSLQAQ